MEGWEKLRAFEAEMDGSDENEEDIRMLQAHENLGKKRDLRIEGLKDTEVLRGIWSATVGYQEHIRNAKLAQTNLLFKKYKLYPAKWELSGLLSEMQEGIRENGGLYSVVKGVVEYWYEHLKVCVSAPSAEEPHTQQEVDVMGKIITWIYSLEGVYFSDNSVPSDSHQKKLPTSIEAIQWKKRSLRSSFLYQMLYSK